MKALIYKAAGERAVYQRPRPELSGPGDVIVKMTMTTIRGTGLLSLTAEVASCAPGRIRGA